MQIGGYRDMFEFRKNLGENEASDVTVAPVTENKQLVRYTDG